MRKIRLNLEITPLRLVVVLVSLSVVGLSEWFGWNIPTIYSILPVILVVFLTQPKK